MTGSHTHSHAVLLDGLRHAVGAAHVLTDGDLSEWEVDWRRKQRGRALAVVLPGNTEEVAAVVKLCRSQGLNHPEERVSLVPQGGNTGLVGGSTPDPFGQQIVLSTKRMNAVRQMDTDNLTATVEAGCILQQLQEAAETAGLLFPLSLAAEGSCTIGGNLGTNAGGTQVLRYGNARDLCLGLEVVTPHGDIWHGLTGLRKDNTGYDLRHLLVGSEGTLGIITAATMKLFPQPAAQLTAWVLLPDLPSAVALLALAHQHLGPGLTGFEVMAEFGVQLVSRHFPAIRIPIACSQSTSDSITPAPWHLLIEYSDHESQAHGLERFQALLELAMQNALVLDAVLAQTLSQAQHMWHVRETIPMAQVQEGLNIKHDISVPVSRICAFVAAADASLQALLPGIRFVNFGHLGDGNLHYNVQAPEGMPPADFLRDHEREVTRRVYERVAQYGGSFSAEHGVGSFKRDELVHYKSPVALDMMRAIKQALDPQGLMNPGRML